MIETARLVLRPCREDDKAGFAAILNTPAMMAELGGVKTQAEIDMLIDKRVADQARNGFSYWAVEERDGAALVGTCGIRIASNYPGTPVVGMHEIGWRIAETHWAAATPAKPPPRALAGRGRTPMRVRSARGRRSETRRRGG